MSDYLASIDIGTHTARLLIAERSSASSVIRPLARERAYIRLAEGFEHSGKRVIQPNAIDRTLKVLEEFLSLTQEFHVHSIHAVATGLVREAANGQAFLRRIHQHTGTPVKCLTGDEEAYLTGKGVIRALNIHAGPYCIFDLGGGSLEFLFRTDGSTAARSLPIGAKILTQKYVNADPPETSQIVALTRHIDKCLRETDLLKLGTIDNAALVGTGGTVITLAALHFGIALDKLTPEAVNGLILKTRQVKAVFEQIRGLGFEERVGLLQSDAGRAEVILAGCLIVLRILTFFNAIQLVVSLSDLLEGILIECVEGEPHG